MPVLGTGREAGRIIERLHRREFAINEIVVAMPSASGRQIADALANCRATGIPCKMVPA